MLKSLAGKQRHRTLLWYTVLIFLAIGVGSEAENGNPFAPSQFQESNVAEEAPCDLLHLPEDMQLIFVQMQGSHALQLNKPVSTLKAGDFHSFLVDMFRKSKSAACISDHEYVQYVAAQNFELFRTLLFGNLTQKRWARALKEFRDSPILYPNVPNYRTVLGSPALIDLAADGRSLIDTEILKLWLNSVAHGVVLARWPFSSIDGGSASACYVHNQSLGDMINCFRHYALQKKGVLCGNITFAIRQNDSLDSTRDKIVQLEKCVEGVHLEVAEFNRKGAILFPHLRNWLLSCWAQRFRDQRWNYSVQQMRECGRLPKEVEEIANKSEDAESGEC